MKTSALIDVLANGAGAAPKAVAARRIVPAALLGALAATGLALAIIGPVNDLPAIAVALSIKLVYALAFAAAAGWLAARLARPAARFNGATIAVGVVMVGMALVGLAALGATAAGERSAYLLGHSWATCPWAVLGLSLPALFATFHALRGLAPTRPRIAGLAAGLLAGAVGAFGYAFSCLETSTTFIALWYTLGIVMAGALGAALGPRWLRW